MMPHSMISNTIDRLINVDSHESDVLFGKFSSEKDIFSSTEFSPDFFCTFCCAVSLKIARRKTNTCVSEW